MISKRVELKLGPLPCLANLRNDQQRDHIESLIEKIVAAADFDPAPGT